MTVKVTLNDGSEKVFDGRYRYAVAGDGSLVISATFGRYAESEVCRFASYAKVEYLKPDSGEDRRAESEAINSLSSQLHAAKSEASFWERQCAGLQVSLSKNLASSIGSDVDTITAALILGTGFVAGVLVGVFVLAG